MPSTSQRAPGSSRRSRSRCRPRDSRSRARDGRGRAAARTRGMHQPRQFALGVRRTSATGRSRLSSKPSSRWRSLMVSIGPKNPSYGYATTSPRGSAARTSPRRARRRLDLVEQLAAAHEEPAVDAHVRSLRSTTSLRFRARRSDAVRVELWPHREELHQLAGARTRDHLVERSIRQTVAVCREKLVVSVQVPLDRLQPPADRRLHPGGREGDPPLRVAASAAAHVPCHRGLRGRSH